MIANTPSTFNTVGKLRARLARTDELDTHRDYIDSNYLNHLDGVFGDEELLRVKIGLFGRARMFLDAQTPVVVQIWRPQP
jgi:hypothetical protein